MSTPGSGAAELHGLVSDGRGGWELAGTTGSEFEPAAAPSWDDPLPDGQLPPVAEGWLPEVDPLDGAGNGTGPHEFPPAGDRAEPVVSEPEQAMRAVAAGQPGTWPTSPLDLAAGPPETSADLRGAVEIDLAAGEPAVPDAVVTAFRANVKIDPTTDTGSFELTVAGPAAFVSALVETFASSFLYETQRAP